MEEQQTGEYQANDADAIIGEIFSGGITVAEAIERLRTRLLDLSSRNRLLNYRHPKGRSVQIADNPSINLVFDWLMDPRPSRSNTSQNPIRSPMRASGRRRDSTPPASASPRHSSSPQTRRAPTGIGCTASRPSCIRPTLSGNCARSQARPRRPLRKLRLQHVVPRVRVPGVLRQRGL